MRRRKAKEKEESGPWNPKRTKASFADNSRRLGCFSLNDSLQNENKVQLHCLGWMHAKGQPKHARSLATKLTRSYSGRGSRPKVRSERVPLGTVPKLENGIGLYQGRTRRLVNPAFKVQGDPSWV